MATISRSHRPTACRTTSRWPLVTGSNEPGYSAIRGIAPPTAPRAARQAELGFALRRALFHGRFDHETKLRGMKPFSAIGEDSPKRRLGINPQRTTGPKRSRQGTVMI